MVEEIHTLETKSGGGGGAGVVGEAGSSGGGKTEGKGGTTADDNQVLMNNRLLSDKQQAAAECSDMMVSSAFTMNRLMMMNNNNNNNSNTTETTTTGTWDDQEKRSRLDCRNIPGVGGGGSLVGFMPYQQSGIDIGGLGAVSLTLGLRQNNAGVGSDQQGVQQQHENHQFRRHFGDHIIYDFVG